MKKINISIEESALKVRSFNRSFLCAAEGIAFCLRHERNMRIHLSITFYVLCFSVFYDLSSLEYAVLLTVIGLVLAAEAINTAVEAIININIEYYHKLARIAKDAAAGAVLMCSLSAMAVGCILFLKFDEIFFIINFLYTDYFYGIIFLLSIPAALIFIFFYPFRIKHIGRTHIEH